MVQLRRYELFQMFETIHISLFKNFQLLTAMVATFHTSIQEFGFHALRSIVSGEYSGIT